MTGSTGPFRRTTKRLPTSDFDSSDSTPITAEIAHRFIKYAFTWVIFGFWRGNSIWNQSPSLEWSQFHFAKIEESLFFKYFCEVTRNDSITYASFYALSLMSNFIDKSFNDATISLIWSLYWRRFTWALFDFRIRNVIDLVTFTGVEQFFWSSFESACLFWTSLWWIFKFKNGTINKTF